MSKKRRQHSPDLKAKVGLEALKGIEPVHAIAAKYQVHPVQVSQWKKEAAERLPEVFARKADQNAQEAMFRRRLAGYTELGYQVDMPRNAAPALFEVEADNAK